jgi:hypothetical protein
MAVLVFSGGHYLKVRGTMREAVRSTFLMDTDDGWAPIATEPDGSVVLVNPQQVAYVAENADFDSSKEPYV